MRRESKFEFTPYLPVSSSYQHLVITVLSVICLLHMPVPAWRLFWYMTVANRRTEARSLQKNTPWWRNKEFFLLLFFLQKSLTEFYSGGNISWAGPEVIRTTNSTGNVCYHAPLVYCFPHLRQVLLCKVLQTSCLFSACDNSTHTYTHASHRVRA